MATGKTNSRHFRLYADQVDLSGDVRTVGGFGLEYNMEDVTGWSDGVVNYLYGTPTAFVNGFQAVFNNTAVTGSHTELSDQEEYLISLHLGIRATPAAGDPAFGGPLQQSSYTVGGEGPVIVEVALNGPGQALSHPSRYFGYVAYPSTSITVTTSGTGVDMVAAQASGIHAVLHVLTAETVGTWALTIQESSDDAVGDPYVDIITFTANGATATAERGIDATSVERYVRFRAVYTGGGSTGARFVVTVIPQ